MFEALERNNLFVVALDDQRRWYRYHHLFADALRARLAAEQPERVARLHAAASRWYADHGLLDDAVAHAIEAGDAERAADLIELALPELRRRQRQDRTLRGWLTALPDDVVRGRALLSAFLAWTRLVEGDLDGVEARLRDAERALEAMPVSATADNEELRTLPAWIEIYRASAAQARGDADGRPSTRAGRSSWPALTTISRGPEGPGSSDSRRGRPATSRPPSRRSRRR